MTTEPDVYTTIGHDCGCCGHRHRSCASPTQVVAAADPRRLRRVQLAP